MDKENGPCLQKGDARALPPIAMTDITNVANVSLGTSGVPVGDKLCAQSDRLGSNKDVPRAKVARIDVAFPKCDTSAVKLDSVQTAVPRKVARNVLEAEYIRSIHDVRLLAQRASQPNANYLAGHPQLTASSRAVLVDWLVEVSVTFNLRMSTLFLSIRLLDSYMTLVKGSVPKRLLQLVGATAMMIASKFEEVTPPDLQDFIYVAADAYTKDQFLRMEVQMLTVLDFRMATPTAAHFVEHAATSPLEAQVAQFFLELTLGEYSMIRHAPSHLACAALLLARRVLKLSPVWPVSTAADMQASEESLHTCVKEMDTIWHASKHSSLHAVRKKFKRSKCPETVMEAVGELL